MASRWRNALGKRIRDAGARIRCAICPCCDCGTGGPTADFSYTQTNDDPCTFTFHDESVAGACGAIVSWLWDFGDGNTSTSQNPTHAYSGSYPSGPWDVTLTVTDEAGCDDSVVMEVTCQECSASCGCCLPNTLTATFGDCPPGAPDPIFGRNCKCEWIGGRSFTLTGPSPWEGGGNTGIFFCDDLGGNYGFPTGLIFNLRFSISCVGDVRTVVFSYADDTYAGLDRTVFTITESVDDPCCDWTFSGGDDSSCISNCSIHVTCA